MKKYNNTNTPIPPNLRRHAPFSGYIIVRLTNQYAESEGLLSSARSSTNTNFPFFFNKIKSKPQDIERLIPDNLVKELLEIERIAQRSNFPPIRSLTTYWRMDYRNTEKQNLDSIITMFNRFAEIDIAYRELLVYDPNDDMNTPSFHNRQEYLNSAVEGIDAKWVWDYEINEQKIEGQGVGFIDLEQGWEFPHQELPNISDADLLVNNNAKGATYQEKNQQNVLVTKTYTGQHGINVLSIVAAKDDGKGTKGIAPKTEYVKLASHYKYRTISRNIPQRLNNGYIEEAIIKTLSGLLNGVVTTGDILLLEVQKKYHNNIKLPAEIEIANFDAIRLASALGFIVIEAAGNGGINLNNAIHPDIPKLMEKEDSGAIMVASAISLVSEDDSSKVQYNRAETSNYGNRINCFAPIQNMDISPLKFIVAGGAGNIYDGAEQPNERYNNYSDDFGGTSGASAIIAGAAILLQSAYKMKNNTPLSPFQMRKLLSNPNTGTKANTHYIKGAVPILPIPIVNGSSDHIGVMPNLRAIIETESISLPDLYIRKCIGDVGNVPFPMPDSIDSSPDIIVCNERLEKPFGIGGKEENPLAGTTIVDKTVPNHVYVRVWNRGTGNVENVTVGLYWRKVRRPIYEWNSIDTSLATIVAQGGSEFVSFEWRNIPTRGDFYLIAITKQLEYDNLLLPTRAENNENSFEELLFSEHIFEQFVRNNNNVACLKFSVPSGI